jgi:cytochrome c oxidase subunit 2
VLVAALVYAGVAYAGNGGFAPPTPESPNAQRITDAYWLIFGLTAGIFVIVEGALVVFVLRFRSRGRRREVEGPQIRGNTQLEIAWTVVPVLILAGIAAFVLYKLPGIKNVPNAQAGGPLAITVEGHQFYWQYDYPGGQISIDRLVVPVGQVVTLKVEGLDVIHSWWAPSLAGKIDAIPGRTNHTWFQAKDTGEYPLRCAELCGIEHAHMTGVVDVVSRQDYESFLASHAATSPTLGSEIVQSVCGKCHGFTGQGDIGPKIAQNPLIDDTSGLETLLRNGRGPQRTQYRMPAVGATWGNDEMHTAIKALQAKYGTKSGG